MAQLYNRQAPVNYQEQQSSFEDFLKTFKTTTTEATDALEDLTLNDDDLDEEYDFMDESGDEAARSRRPDRKLKYLRALQNVADRMTNQITIDLDDLSAVSGGRLFAIAN